MHEGVKMLCLYLLGGLFIKIHQLLTTIYNVFVDFTVLYNIVLRYIFKHNCIGNFVTISVKI